jgi:hypothetical protein
MDASGPTDVSSTPRSATAARSGRALLGRELDMKALYALLVGAIVAVDARHGDVERAVRH